MPEQRNFIDAELLQLTLSAVMQRGQVYRPNLTEEIRKPVHLTLQSALRTITSSYKTQVNEEMHFANIQTVANQVSAKHADVLNGCFRIGSAQKALNLLLKYQWCLGEIPEPPHCPFDSFVLRSISGWKTKRWTAINAMEQYRKLVAAARLAAGKKSLPIWELELYNEAVKPKSGRE